VNKVRWVEVNKLWTTDPKNPLLSGWKVGCWEVAGGGAEESCLGPLWGFAR